MKRYLTLFPQLIKTKYGVLRSLHQTLIRRQFTNFECEIPELFKRPSGQQLFLITDRVSKSLPRQVDFLNLPHFYFISRV